VLDLWSVVYRADSGAVSFTASVRQVVKTQNLGKASRPGTRES
jgi:hypothetical protein